MARIAHLTSVHPRYDTRIFVKMCRSVAQAGHEAILVVADGRGDEEKDGVSIIDVGRASGRLSRMIKSARAVYRRAIHLDADIYHIHDPELLPFGWALTRRGKCVIFDAHEDLPRQMLSKPYLPAVVRPALSAIFARLEGYVCRKLAHIVAATPTIRDKFLLLDIEAVDIKNFPILGELQTSIGWSEKAREVCYVGGLFGTRGVREIADALAQCRSGARLNLAGAFVEPAIEAAVRASPGWTKVNELGFVSRDGVRDVLARSMAGLVTLHPTPAYLDSLPVKMFEYMSAGLPVIASDFPLWREIVEGNDCGMCVDPLNPKAIAAAIDHLVDNPERARQMGENGRRAVEERYNWGVEEKKLLDLYARLLSEHSTLSVGQRPGK